MGIAYLRCRVILRVRVFFYFYATNINYNNTSITLTFTSLWPTPWRPWWVEFKEEPRGGSHPIREMRASSSAVVQ